MFSLFGPNESIKNIYLLSKAYIPSSGISNTNELRPYYLDFLQAHQPTHPINRSKNIFISDVNIEEGIKSAYQPGALNDLNQQGMIGEPYSDDERAHLIELVRDGYNKLGEIDVNLKHIFDLVIHSIFFRKSSNHNGASSFGGSASSAMGSIWISGHGELTVDDVTEFLLHELTHHLLFIDERCHAQFNYESMVRPENYATSVLLKKHRPMDKVVHSIVVSAEIILARDNIIKSKYICVHPDTQSLMDSTLASINEIFMMNNIDNIITTRTRKILEKALSALSGHSYAVNVENIESSIC